MEIRPLFGLFFIFQDLAFLKLLMAKFGLFHFFVPGNPALETVLRTFEMRIIF